MSELLNQEEPAKSRDISASESPSILVFQVPDKIYGVSVAARTAPALSWSEDLCWPTLSLLTGTETGQKNLKIQIFRVQISGLFIFLFIY